MRILYVSQYFPPEIGAPAVRVSEMSAHWRDWGEDVLVLTGFPNHQDGEIHPNYRAAFRRGAHTETFRGLQVYRTWLYPAANKGVFRRSANYASFMLSAIARGAWLGFRPEVVIGTSPQLLCAVAAARLARRFRARFVLEVRDLWPESLEAVGVCARGSLAYRALDRIALRLYRDAWKIVVVTETFRDALVERGVDGAKIAVVKNGVDTSFFHPDAAPSPWVRSQERLQGKFIVSYIGTHGMAHALETVLDTAALLRDEKQIHFLLVGEGARLEDLRRRQAELNLDNVSFAGPQPWADIPSYLGASDLSIIHLARTPVFRTVIPSKMFEVMAAGRAIVLGVEGEARAILEESDAGLAVEPESPPAMRDAVLALYRDSDRRGKLGRNGRDYVCRTSSYRARARDYLDVLQPSPAIRAAETRQ